MHIGKDNLYQHLGPHSGTDMDAHRAIPSTGHSGVSPCQQHTHVPYHHTSSSTHLSQDPPYHHSDKHKYTPLNPFPSPPAPFPLFRCSEVPQVPSEHHLRAWVPSFLGVQLLQIHR